MTAATTDRLFANEIPARRETLNLISKLLRAFDPADLSEEDAQELACILLGAEMRIKHRQGDSQAVIDFRGWMPSGAAERGGTERR